MQFVSRTLLGGVFALACATASAAPINVAVIGGSSGTDSSAAVAAQLNDDTHGDFSATVITGSVASLAGYDVVVLGGSGFSTNEYSGTTLATVRAFMEAGGGVVTSGWYRYAVMGASGQAATDADAVTPIVTALTYDFVYDSTLNITNTTHAITAGVADITVPGCCIELASTTDAGAVTLGVSSLPGLAQGGNVGLAYQDTVGRSVYLGLLFMANGPQYNNGALRSGDADQLLEQAVTWAAGADIPEPGTLALVALAAVGALRARRQRA
jgi:hypothetical protein